MSRQFRIIGVLTILCLSGCAESSEQQPTAEAKASTKPAIVVSCYPLFAMVDELAGNSVTLISPNDQKDASLEWSPKAEDIRAMQAADLILLNGAGFEPWTQNLSLPRSRTVTTSSAYAERLLQIDGSMTHQHGPRGDGTNRLVASATWLDPELAAAQLNQVAKSLCKLLPDQQDRINKQATTMAKLLRAQQSRLENLRSRSMESVAEFSVAADSADLIYLTSSLGWTLHTIDTADTTSQLNAAIAEFQPQLLLFLRNAPTESAKAFVEAEVPHVTIDVCLNSDRQLNFIERLAANVDRLETAVNETLNAQKRR